MCGGRSTRAVGCRELIVACDDCVAACWWWGSCLCVVQQNGRSHPLSAAAHCESRAAILSGGITVSSASTMRAPRLVHSAGHLRPSHRFVSVAVLNILITVTTLSEDSSRGDRRPLHTRDPGGCVQRTQFSSTSIRRDMNAKSLSRAPRTRGAAHLPCSKTTS